MFTNNRARWLLAAMLCIGVVDAAVSAEPVAAAAQAVNIAFKTDALLRSGDNKIEVTVSNADGSPLSDATVSATFSMPAMPSMNMPAMRKAIALASKGNGQYQGNGELEMGGTWELAISVMRDGKKIGDKKMSVIAK